jgi:hypothetical protein
MKKEALILILIIPILIIPVSAFTFEEFREGFSSFFSPGNLITGKSQNNFQQLPDPRPPWDKRPQECSDGTWAGACVIDNPPVQCSTSYPYHLVNNCDFCGCPLEFPRCTEDGSCTNETGSPSMQLVNLTKDLERENTREDNKKREQKTPFTEQKIESCIDGTLVTACSENRPLFCGTDGRLIRDCSVCGCDEGFSCDENLGYCLENVAISRRFKFFKVLRITPGETSLISGLFDAIIKSAQPSKATPLEPLYSDEPTERPSYSPPPEGEEGSDFKSEKDSFTIREVEEEGVIVPKFKFKTSI